MQLGESFLSILNAQLSQRTVYYGEKQRLQRVTWWRQPLYSLGFRKEERWESIVKTVCYLWDQAQVNNEVLDKESLKAIREKVREHAPKLTYLLDWRIGEQIGEINQEIDFTVELNDWKERKLKQKQGVDYSKKFKIFNENIKEFPEFASLIKENKKLRKEFFRWAVRDGNITVKKMRLFIEHAGMYQKIKSCFLAGWIGKATDDDFELKDKRIVQLKFDGEMVDFHEENQTVHFKSGYQTTVAKVVDCFKNKPTGAGDFIFVKDRGVIDYNSYIGAYRNAEGGYDPIYLKENVLDAIPIVETKTLEEMQEMFPRHQGELNNDSQWFVLRATKDNMDQPMDIMKTHAMLTLISGDGNGNFHFRHLGAYPEVYPTSKLGQLLFVTQTDREVISTVDENFVYENRAHALLVKPMKEGEFDRLQVALKKMLEWNFNGMLAFQFLVNGCGRFLEDMHYLVFGERFRALRTPLTEARPGGVLEKVIKVIAIAKRAFRCLGLLIFYTVATLMLGFKGRNAIYIPESFQDMLSEEPSNAEELKNTLSNVQRIFVSLWKLADRNLTMYHPGKLFHEEGVYLF